MLSAVTPGSDPAEPPPPVSRPHPAATSSSTSSSGTSNRALLPRPTTPVDITFPPCGRPGFQDLYGPAGHLAGTRRCRPPRPTRPLTALRAVAPPPPPIRGAAGGAAAR